MRVTVPISRGAEAEAPLAVAAGERTKRARCATGSTFIAPIIRWAFYAFVFSLPFEMAGSGLLEPPTILGAMLLLTTLFQPGLFLRWPPPAFWSFIVYLYLFTALGALEPDSYRAEALRDIFLLVQLTLLSWIAYNLMRDERVARTALLMFVMACALLSALQVLGVAAQPTDIGAKAERVTALGFHPNNLARILTLGLLALVGLAYSYRRTIVRPRFLIWPLVALIGIALVQTGSRGALVALGAGLMVFVLKAGSLWLKLRNVLGIALVMAFFIWAGFQFEGTRIRFEKTLEEGDMARREQIYPTAWEMFLEKPFAGWGSTTSSYELGSRLGHPEEESKNPHNLILYALVSTGLLGAIPLFIGIGLVALNAWRARYGPQGILPLAMLVAVLAANMSGLWLFNKLHWLVMAYALAASVRKAEAVARLPRRRLFLRAEALNGEARRMESAI